MTTPSVSMIKNFRAQSKIKEPIFDQALEAEGSVHRKDRLGKTALFYARNIPEAQYLLSKGARLDETDKNGQTVLHQARQAMDAGLVQFFLNRSSFLELRDHQGNTPLMSVARYGKSVELVQLYLNAGCDPYTTNNMKQTLLHMGVINKACPVQNDLIKMIVGCGLDVNATDARGIVALHAASQYTGDDPCVILKLLMEHGADVHARNDSGQTALHMHLNSITSVLSLDVVKVLLESGVEPNAQDKNGDTAFHLVFDQKRTKDLVELLFEYGMDFYLENNEQEPAHKKAGWELYPFIQAQTSKMNIKTHLKDTQPQSVTRQFKL